MKVLYKLGLCLLTTLSLLAFSRGDTEITNVQSYGTTDSYSFSGSLVDSNAKFIADLVTNVTFDKGFTVTVYRSTGNKALMADVSFGSITETQSNNPTKNAKTLLFGNKWGNLQVDHYGPPGNGYFALTRSLGIGKCSVSFNANFTEAAIHDANGYHAPAEFKFSQDLSNFKYKYANSILTFTYGITSSTTVRYDPDNNRVLFGADETEFSWFPYMLADGMLVEVQASFTPYVACDDKIFYKCRNNPKFSYHLLNFSVRTNAVDVFWDPRFVGGGGGPPNTDTNIGGTETGIGGGSTTSSSSGSGPTF